MMIGGLGSLNIKNHRGQIIPFAPNDWQMNRILWFAALPEPVRWAETNLGRQVGATTLFSAIIYLQTGIHPDRNGLILAPNPRTAEAITSILHCFEAVRRLPQRIQVYTANQLRRGIMGLTYHYVLIDQMLYFHDVEAVLTVLCPMIPTNKGIVFITNSGVQL
jgi:hypothetical protein